MIRSASVRHQVAAALCVNISDYNDYEGTFLHIIAQENKHGKDKNYKLHV